MLFLFGLQSVHGGPCFLQGFLAIFFGAFDGGVFLQGQVHARQASVSSLVVFFNRLVQISLAFLRALNVAKGIF